MSARCRPEDVSEVQSAIAGTVACRLTALNDVCAPLSCQRLDRYIVSVNYFSVLYRRLAHSLSHPSVPSSLLGFGAPASPAYTVTVRAHALKAAPAATAAAVVDSPRYSIVITLCASHHFFPLALSKPADRALLSPPYRPPSALCPACLLTVPVTSRVVISESTSASQLLHTVSCQQHIYSQRIDAAAPRLLRGPAPAIISPQDARLPVQASQSRARSRPAHSLASFLLCSLSLAARGDIHTI